jgi:hypothetical protein
MQFVLPSGFEFCQASPVRSVSVPIREASVTVLFEQAQLLKSISRSDDRPRAAVQKGGDPLDAGIASASFPVEVLDKRQRHFAVAGPKTWHDVDNLGCQQGI